MDVTTARFEAIEAWLQVVFLQSRAYGSNEVQIFVGHTSFLLQKFWVHLIVKWADANGPYVWLTVN